MSDDGYIRLQYTAFQAIRLVHLLSGLDEDGPPEGRAGAVPTAITGYTEWVSTQIPVITIGWDWQMLGGSMGIRLQRVSLPRSNVLFQNRHSVDVGPDRTTSLLEEIIDELDWEDQALAHLNMHYSN